HIPKDGPLKFEPSHPTTEPTINHCSRPGDALASRPQPSTGIEWRCVSLMFHLVGEPTSVPSRGTVEASQTRTVWSSEALARRLTSGLEHPLKTLFVWPLRVGAA